MECAQAEGWEEFGRLRQKRDGMKDIKSDPSVETDRQDSFRWHGESCAAASKS